MMKYLIITMIILMNFLFCILNHPMSLGLTLLIQTINLAMLIGLMNMTFWYSYVMFLIMVGALIVLFIYMTSLTPNKKFKFNMLSLILIMMFTITMLMCMFLTNDWAMMYSMIDSSEDTMYFYNNIINNNMHNEMNYMTWLYNKMEMWMTFILINYLLFSLIIVVKIIDIKKGTMRKMN